MKIVQLVPAMDQGGVERGIVEMNRVLIAAGHDNLVISAGGRLEESILSDGGRIARVDIKSKNPFTAFSRARKLREVLESERPDVVVAHSRVPAWLFVIANKKLSLPWITFAHGANSVSAYSKVMTYGDVTVTPSQYIADYLVEHYKIDRSLLRVIPRAIDRNKFDTSKLDTEFMAAKRAEWKLDGFRVVMGLGRITQLKGYDVLIRALSRLQSTHVAAGVDTPDWKLVIVGEAEALRKEYEDELHKLVEELGVSNHVVFAGAQSKVAECLSLADIVVSANYRKPEAFGRSMAEALAMDKPVVATAFGGALDIVEDGVNGALVAPDPKATPQEMAVKFSNAIRFVAHSKFERLREKALEKFSFDRMAASSLAVYNEFDKEIAK